MENPEVRRQRLEAADLARRELPGDAVVGVGKASDDAAGALGRGEGGVPDDFYQHIFDGSGLGIALVDPDGRPILSNSALERMLGYDRDELGRLAFPQFTHPDDVALDAELFQELLTGKRQQYQIERRYVRKDGSTVNARLTVSLVPGGSKRAIAMVEDISAERAERARHAATLRTLEDRVAELTAIHELSAALRDPARPLHDVLADVARALHAASRAPSESGVRVSLGDVTTEAGSTADAVCVASAAFGPAVGVQGLIEILHAGASPTSAHPAAGDNAQRMVQTIAEHLGSEVERRRAVERLGLAVADGKVAVWELDFRTGKLAWPGQPPSTGREGVWRTATTIASFMELVHRDDRGSVEREIRAATDDPKRKGRYQAEYRIAPPEGDVRVILASGQTVYDDERKPERMFGVAVDVTDRRALERRLLQAQKMEAIGQLAGGVAHDFNNLLCVILGFGELVAATLGPTHPETAHVDQIVRAGRAAEALTRQLLAFSRRQVLQPRVLDLNGVVRGVEKMVRRLIGEDISLVTDLTSDPAIIRVDPGQVEQVLINLVVNARDAMPKGGALTIRTTFAPGGAGWSASGDEISVGPWVVLSVADTGVGMDPATQARVFEPFFTTKPSGSGTGLGLATVYGIVNQSGGQIELTSAPGEGAEFRIHLPRVALEAEDAERAPVDLRGYGGKETVLVAEDQTAVREIVRIWLERRGYRVLDAVNGTSGMEVAAAHAGEIDLLVTDAVMPGASGRELADALRVNAPALPVIYVSGYSPDAIARRGILEPGVRLLAKPLSEAVLLRAVREALDAARPIVGRGDAGE